MDRPTEPECNYFQLTSDELAFANYATDLADWLGPYHDHVRPPPSVVLAEAAKQSELKTGYPLKGVDLPITEGNGNGHSKKVEDSPPVKEPPMSLADFFGGNLLRIYAWRT